MNGTADDLSPKTNSDSVLGSTASSVGRRKKRKSAVPKRRVDVLRMKRHQWLSDDESASEPEMFIEPISVDGNTTTVCGEDGDRPSSGDRCCHSFDDGTPVLLPLVPSPPSISGFLRILEKDKTSSATLALATATDQDILKVSKDNEPMDLITRSDKNDKNSVARNSSNKRRDSVIRIATKKIKIKTEPGIAPSGKKWCSTNEGFLSVIPSGITDLNNRSSSPTTTSAILSKMDSPLLLGLLTIGLVQSSPKYTPNELSIVESRCVEKPKDVQLSSRADEPSDSSVISPTSANPTCSSSSVTSVAGCVDSSPQRSLAGGQPRSYYKSISQQQQQRIENSARERNRLRTISAAFETLRRAIPTYAHSRKLSRLAILKIANSYIMALASLNEMDCNNEKGRPNFAECVKLCTQTIQSESKARRRGSTNKLISFPRIAARTLHNLPPLFLNPQL